MEWLTPQALNLTIAPTRSTDYYVKVTDNFGCSATGGVFVFVVVDYLGQGEVEIADQIEVYPNPASGVLNIEAPVTGNRNLHFALTDLSGKVVQEFSEGNVLIQQELNIPDGVYLLKITENTNLIETRKVVVQH